MTERKYSVERDLQEAHRMVEALDPYVYQDQLYMPISGSGLFSPMPALTIGAALLRLRRLEALRDQLTPAQQSELDALESQNQKVWEEWHVHYERKLMEEAKSRLKLLTSYIEDCKEDARGCAGNYPAEALRRTIVQEIIIFVEQHGIHSAELDRSVARVDSGLRGIIRPDGFLWSPQLQPVYRADTFWWLYGAAQG